ncbi:DUF6049 family protein [Microbacterium sp. A84]|uniref:DUF6049 family protein n=1 Tax=Microbacterium sp. A84 TaxID=3450715 RepID=UPI003F431AD0
MISPRIGSRVRAQRCARGFVAFSLTAGLLAAPHFIAVSPAAAAVTAVEDTDAGTVELSLSAGLHGVIQPGVALTTSITINNSSDEELPAGRVAIELNRTPLADRTAVTSWLDAGETGGEFDLLSSELSTAVPASETAMISAVTPVTTLGVLADGVYPLRVTLEDGTTGDASDTDAPRSITANSVLIVSAGAATQVTIMVPITATPADGALLTADELSTLTAPDGALTAQLDGISGTAAVLAVDPLIPAAIRVLGSAAPLTASDWLARLETLSNERFALQYGDADATVQAQADLPELLSPLPFTSYLNEANFLQTEGTATPSPSPSPSPTPTAPALPTDDELTMIDAEESGILWPLGDVNTADLAKFATYFDSDVTTILPSSSIAAPTGALIEIDGDNVLVMDATASATLSDAAAEEDAALREHEIAEALAQLTFTGGHTPLLVGLDRDENRTADALRETILSLSTISEPIGLDALRTAAPASATLAVESSADRVAVLSKLLADEAHLAAFSSILDDPLVLRSPERLQILRLIGVGASDSYAEDAGTHQAKTSTTLNAVGVQQPSPIQLFTSAAPLPVWVRNDLPWPVNVTLTSTPSDARLDVQPTKDFVAQPANNERVKVPVEARVGSGELEVSFSLSSPTGVPIGVDQTAKVTVRAEWENIGLGILGGVIALLLVLGVVRTVVRRRKAAGQPTSVASEDSAEEVTGE